MIRIKAMVSGYDFRISFTYKVKMKYNFMDKANIKSKV
jgi:hypothetical protein